MTDADQQHRFQHALEMNMTSYGVTLSVPALEQLGAYYSLVMKWNSLLHLVAPCSPGEFAIRHVLESLLVLQHLPHSAKVVDIGSGAGLPILPCLIVRPDLTATLIESSQKKSVFLREGANQLGVSERVTIIAEPFENTIAPHISFLTCRALDQFMRKVTALIRWAPENSTLLLFGGESLREQLRNEGAAFEEFLVPLSEKRFLFVVHG